jgi:two-component sensor histidine kinase
MALHELGTNAVKYGALSNTAGTVDVSWELITEGAHQFLILTWVEAGGPAVAPPTRHGFGSRMVERALRSQRGNAEIEFPPEAVKCVLRLPA